MKKVWLILSVLGVFVGGKTEGEPGGRNPLQFIFRTRMRGVMNTLHLPFNGNARVPFRHFLDRMATELNPFLLELAEIQSAPDRLLLPIFLRLSGPGVALAQKFATVAQCRAPQGYSRKEPEDFTVDFFSQLLSVANKIFGLYHSLYKDLNEDFRSLTVEAENQDVDFESCRVAWEKNKRAFDALAKHLDHISFRAQLLKMVGVDCSVRDMLHFYKILKRFSLIYKTRTSRHTKNFKFLGKLRRVWSNRAKLLFRQAGWVFLWFKVFENVDQIFADTKETPENKQAVLLSMESLVRYSEAMNEMIANFPRLSKDLQAVQVALFNTVMTIERDSGVNEKKITPFPDLREAFKNLPLLVLSFAAIFAFF